MIDLHCHVLPGIDDGPANMEEALALALAAAADGTATIVATPHVSREMPNSAATIARSVAEVNVQLAAATIDLRVVSGAEIAVTIVDDLDSDELATLTLGGGPWLLIESPLTAIVTSGLEAALFRLQLRGYQIVLAHPERSPTFHREPELLARLVTGGMLCSVTAGALVGRFGATVERFARGMIRDRLVHNVASDAHDAARRRPGMRSELEQAGLGAVAEWLTREMPAAIVAGDPLPARPELWPELAPEPRRGWRRWVG